MSQKAPEEYKQRGMIILLLLFRFEVSFFFLFQLFNLSWFFEQRILAKPSGNLETAVLRTFTYFMKPVQLWEQINLT